MSKKSELERVLLKQLNFLNLPTPERQHRFHPVRRWRFDFAYPERKIAIEVEGGTWVRGAHSRGAGYTKDCEKYNAATAMGWRVFIFTSDMIHDGKASVFITDNIVNVNGFLI